MAAPSPHGGAQPVPIFTASPDSVLHASKPLPLEGPPPGARSSPSRPHPRVSRHTPGPPERQGPAPLCPSAGVLTALEAFLEGRLAPRGEAPPLSDSVSPAPGIYKTLNKYLLSE